ncbi:T9SS type A sorting domain-containing protein [Aquimarina sp. MMG016]|uniref:T9SS type A sorting domain-containing protein n=1 Tax=Aquimarina sp. MMG016 TaxID=2822690 RepID=UPI001B39E14D|nr:T9SS type A sorting domain-containing protein [Aquimarina sp. MMG016]MBQ4822253.1 T9SS type A sorting domain-containing protein [Aquimarina sp. MMG016]
MQKAYLLLLFVFNFSITQSWGTDINFSDANFKNALINNNVAEISGNGSTRTDVDTNNDGEIQESEAATVLRLFINQKNITSLDGIQYFTNLTFLSCSNNRFTDLDFSQNLALETVLCNNNFNSTNSPLTTNFTQNTNLKRLSFSNTKLATLDLTQNILLEELSCDNSSLMSLDTSKNTNLIRLIAQANNLSNLDLTKNVKLTYLNCADNNFAIDVTQNINLEFLFCNNMGLINLDLTNNTKLKWLACPYNNLTSLDVTQNVNLENLSCGENQLSSLDVTQNTKLDILSFWVNNLTTIDISQNPDLEELSGRDNNLNNLNLTQNLNLASLNINNNPDLACVQVNDVDAANNNSEWKKDETTTYSLNCATLSSNEIGNTPEFTIYPKPTKDLLYISGEENIKSIQIYDINSRVLKSYYFTENQNITKVNLQFLDNGVYFLETKTDKGLSLEKIIKH